MQMSRRLFRAGLLVAVLFAVVGVACRTLRSRIASADEAKPAAKKEPWKPEDFIYSEAVGQYRSFARRQVAGVDEIAPATRTKTAASPTSIFPA